MISSTSEARDVILNEHCNAEGGYSKFFRDQYRYLAESWINFPDLFASTQNLSESVKKAYLRELENLGDHLPDNSFIYSTNKWAGRVFCFVGGFMDTLGYLLLDESFVASITGNVVKGAVQAVHFQFATVLFVISCGYGFGSAIARITSSCLRSRPGCDSLLIGVILMFLEFAALVGGMLICSHMLPTIRVEGEYGFSATAAGVGLAISMGIQVFTR